MRSRRIRWLTSLAVGVNLLTLSSCGSGGGKGGDAASPTIPGTLTVIALEGAPAPGTGSGTFGAFGPTTKLDVADGGWTAFVADVIGGTTTKGLFVQRPDGTVVDVFLKGQAMPAPNGSGTIDDFGRVWMSPGTGIGGVVVAHVLVVGAAIEGIVAARVPTNAAPLEHTGVVARGTVLPNVAGNPSPPGALSALASDLIQVDDQGDIFFVGVGTGGGTPLHGVWTVTRVGTLLTAIAVTGNAAPLGGTLGFDFDGLGVDGDGRVVAYAVSILLGPTHVIIATNGSSAGVIVSEDLAMPTNVGPRTFDHVYAGGPLYVTNAASASFVVWQGDLSGSTPDIGVFARQVVSANTLSLGTLQTLAGPGQGITGLGLGAFMAGIRLLDGAIDPNRMPLLVDVAAGTATKALFSALDVNSIGGVMRDGQSVPGLPATTFSTSLPSLTIAGIRHANRVGSVAFSAVLANATSGVYWEVLSGGAFLLFQVARQGDAAPGAPGGTFGSFATPSPVVTASTFVVFPSTLVGGTIPSGLFRQG